MSNGDFQSDGCSAADTKSHRAPFGQYNLPLEVKDNFDQIFDMEIECWCYGLVRYAGELTDELVHRVIKEMAPVFRNAIQHNYIFNILETAERLSKATRLMVNKKEVVFSILVQLPSPHELDEEAQFVFAQILDQAEQSYGGVLQRMEKRWRRGGKESCRH